MENKKIRVAINGFGRIGRAFFKAAYLRPEIEIVAFNDLGDLDNMAYLLKYDTAYGKAPFDIKIVPASEGVEGGLLIDGKKIIQIQEKDATKLPWGRLNIDIVVESTGFFTDYTKAQVHIDSGAKRVVITGPVKAATAGGVHGETVLMGLNEDRLTTCEITSNASCTTNGVSAVMHILNEKIGVQKALLNTTHAYTATQRLIDGPGGKDLRGGRAAAMNMVPSSTGAAIAVTEAIPAMKGKFDGISVRVPVITGSLADVTFLASRKTTVEEVNGILREAAKSGKWDGIFTATDEMLVSSDIVGEPYGAIADLGMTRVVDGDLVKVMAWYDNETGYTNTLVLHVVAVARILSGN